MAHANGKGVSRIVDYTVWVAGLGLAPGAPVPFGALGMGIVEATLPLAVPDINVIVNIPIANALAQAVADHAIQVNDLTNVVYVGAAAAVVQVRREAVNQADVNLRNETQRINTTLRAQLQNRFDSESDRYRKAQDDLQDDQTLAYELFMKFFQGSAQHAILPYLQMNSFRRALYVLDEMYGLAVANQDAIDILQTQIRTMKFADSENFRTQMDDFEMLLNQLLQLGVGLNDADKKNLLFGAIRNGGIIGRLFASELTLLKSRVVQLGGGVPTWVDTLDIINRRYADLTAEAASLNVLNGPNGRALNARKDSRKKGRHSVYLAEEDGSDEKDEPEHAFAAFAQPNKKAKQAGVKCSKCGRKGHKANECLSEYTCKKCGKRGHKESNCWADTVCDKCGKKGHPTARCRFGNKKPGGGQPPRKGALTAQVMQNAREMSK
jgi:hypothetical protein